MSFFGNIGNAIKKGVTDTGHFVGSVADNKWTKLATAAALAATGAGAPLAAGIMATEGAAGAGLKKGGNLKGALTQGALGAAEGFGASKLGGLARGAFGIGASANGAPASANPTMVSDGNGGWVQQASNGDSSDSGSSWMDKLGGLAKGAGNSLVGSFKNADGSIDWGKLGKLGLGATALYGQHQTTNAANDYQNKMFDLHKSQLDSAKADFASRAPIRQAAQTSITNKLGNQGKNIFSPYLG